MPFLKFTFYLFLITSVVACKNEGTQRPDNVLSPQQMINIQAGVHQTEAELSIRRMDFPVARPLFDKRLDSILKTQHTDTAAYHRSFLWYAENVEEMDRVYQAVIDTLSLRESKRMQMKKDTTRIDAGDISAKTDGLKQAAIRDTAKMEVTDPKAEKKARLGLQPAQ